MAYVINEKQKGRICEHCEEREAFSKGLCKICRGRKRNEEKCEEEGREYKPREYIKGRVDQLIKLIIDSGCSYEPVIPVPFQSTFHEKVEVNGNICLIDKEDKHLLDKWTWRTNRDGYLRRKTVGKVIFLHRVINGTPDGLFTDHINTNKLDNRRCNLRSVTNQQNQFNRICQIGFDSKGVDFFKRTNRWRAGITFNQKGYHIGYFDTKEEAQQAYNDVAKYMFGEFARSAGKI